VIAGQIHRSSVWGYAAALWSLIFAVFHVLWATGWYVGLNPETARIAFAKKPFFVYDLVVAGICVFAVLVALALAMPWGRRLPRLLVGLFAWGGTGLLVLRSVASVIQAVYLIGTRQFPVEIRGLWELWFYLGAILFSLATWRFWHHPVPLDAAEQALPADSAEACVSSNLR
jgi:hypothetical protein